MVTKYDYPYQETRTNCVMTHTRYKISSGANAIEKYSASALKEAVKIRPVVVAIEADKPVF